MSASKINKKIIPKGAARQIVDKEEPAIASPPKNNLPKRDPKNNSNPAKHAFYEIDRNETDIPDKKEKMKILNQVSEIKKKHTPVIVYSAKDFSKKELHHLNHTSNRVLMKGVNSLEHLLEENVGRYQSHQRRPAEMYQSGCFGLYHQTPEN